MNKKNQNKSQTATKESTETKVGPAPRRNRKQRGRRKKPPQEKPAVAELKKKDKSFSNNPKRKVAIQKGRREITLAEGVRSNIMVECAVETKGIECFYLPLITMAMVKGFKNDSDTPIYFAYFALLSDLISIMSTGIGTLSTRLNFLNKILGAYKPKTVPFKTGTLSYVWSNVNSVGIANEIAVRNYRYVMAIPTNSLQGLFQVMVSPPAPVSPDDAARVYALVCTQVADSNRPLLVNESDATLKQEYMKDASPFSACSPYMGAGDTPSSTGPFFSAELEVPKKTTILTGVCAYTDAVGRIPRVFSLGSGSASSPIGLPFVPEFLGKYYKTCYPVQYSFIDLDEVCVYLQSWYLSLATGARSLATQPIPVSQFPFNYSPSLFRIVVRQVILQYFAASQATGQFLTYTLNTGGFEPFRMGTNCYSSNRINMTFPLLLVENIRMLFARFLDIPTNYHNSKNAIVQIPIWGLYKSSIDDPINLTGVLYNDEGSGEFFEQLLFQPPNANELPDPIDGRYSDGVIANLNSPIIKTFIEEWNFRINQMRTVTAPTAFLGGSSDGNLLFHTRFAKYNDVNFPMSMLPSYRHTSLNKSFIRKVSRTVSEKKVTGKNVLATNTSNTVVEEYYVPPDGSLFTQRTTAFSSFTNITNDLVELYNYFILPTIVLEASTPPTQRQWRVGSLQGHVLDLDTETEEAVPDFSSWGNRLIELGALCAPGIAANKADEVTNVINRMSEMSRGGFVGDLLSTLAREIPI